MYLTYVFETRLPSILVYSVSTFTKGEQMVPVLNSCGIHCAVYGNHDFGKYPFLLFSKS